MAISAQSSLFTPSSGAVLERSSDWMAGVLFGEIATILCSLAVALIGGLMLSGRFPLQRSLRVVLGCFILLAAPLITASVMNAGPNAVAIEPAKADYASDMPRGELPPSEYNPYAQASLRANR